MTTEYDRRALIAGLGLAGAASALPAWAQRGFGWLADTTGSFNTGFIAAAFLPLLAAFILVFGWGRDTPSPSPSSSSS